MGDGLKRLRKVSGDHDFDLSDSFSDGPKRVTQSCYFKGGNVVVAIGELNRPNHWDDEAFDAACKHLQTAWNKLLAESASA
jgi:hypothetical protein